MSASLMAIVSSVATISCCLLLGFASALRAGAASVFFTTLRHWLLGFSVVLLSVGFWQQHRAKQCAVRGRLLGSVLLWAALVVVVGMILFPSKLLDSLPTGFTRPENDEEEGNRSGSNSHRFASGCHVSAGSFVSTTGPRASRRAIEYKFQ
jgi:hypothetical protein